MRRQGEGQKAQKNESAGPDGPVLDAVAGEKKKPVAGGAEEKAGGAAAFTAGEAARCVDLEENCHLFAFIGDSSLRKSLRVPYANIMHLCANICKLRVQIFAQ